MPTYAPLVEGRHAGEHLVSDNDANGHLSREKIIVGAGADLQPGTILGQLTTGGATAAAKAGGNTGNGTVGAVTVLDGAVPGIYKVRFTSATAYAVEKPDGDVIGSGATGAAFADDIGFTITAGGTPFVAGDGFDFTVSLTAGVYKQLNPTAADGTEIASGVLYGPAKAASVAVPGVANVRETVVNAGEVTWPAGITDVQKAKAIADLGVHHIILR